MTERILKERRLTIYHNIKDLYGIKEQLNMLMEECGELIQAANKFRRYQDRPDEEKLFGVKEENDPQNPQTHTKWKHNLAEEIGDVEILLEQMRYFYPELKDLIEESKRLKLEKIEGILNRKIREQREQQAQTNSESEKTKIKETYIGLE
jgi:NTP pyrophosphatase (non-canonical NTP hydrolase)